MTAWCRETKSNQRKREGRTDRGWGRRERRARGAPAACRKGGEPAPARAGSRLRDGDRDPMNVSVEEAGDVVSVL